MSQEFLTFCRTGQLKELKKLIDDGFNDLTYENNQGLILAARNDQKAIINFLLQNDAVRELERNNDFPALRLALEFEYLLSAYIISREFDKKNTPIPKQLFEAIANLAGGQRPVPPALSTPQPETYQSSRPRCICQ